MVDAQRAALKAHCADNRVGAILVEGLPEAFCAGSALALLSSGQLEDKGRNLIVP